MGEFNLDINKDEKILLPKKSILQEKKTSSFRTIKVPRQSVYLNEFNLDINESDEKLKLPVQSEIS